MLSIINKYTSYTALISTLKELNTAIYLGATFIKAYEENYTQFHEVLEPYVRSLKNLPDEENKTVTQGFMRGLDTLLISANKAINKIEQAFDSASDQKNSSLAHMLMDELIIKKNDNTWSFNCDSLWYTMDHATNSLFDAVLLKTIHEQRNKRVLFVHVGDVHAEKLAMLLPFSGFEIKASCNNKNDIKPLSKKNSEMVINMEEFLSQCKTLPIN